MATSSNIVILLAAFSCLSFGAELHRKLRQGPPDLGDNGYDGEIISQEANGTQADKQADVGPVKGKGNNHKRFAKRATSWRAEILAGVTKYEFPDIWPGKIVVYGANAEVIGVDDEIDTYMAAAELGKGRVMVFPHETTTKAILEKEPTINQQFLKNLKVWLTKGSYTSDDEICDVTGLGVLDSTPSECKVLVWVGKDAEPEAFYTNLETWLKNGGALVTGYHGWKYVEDNPNTPVWEMPAAKIVNQLGIAFLDGWLSWGKDYTIDDEHDKNCDKANMGKLCESCRTEVTNLSTCRSWLDWVFKINISPSALKELIQIYTDMLEDRGKSTNILPTKSKPVTGEIGRNCTDMICKILVKTGQYNGDFKAPGLNEFPGDFDETPELITGTFTATFNSTYSKAIPTGYFVPAGTELTVTWASPPQGKWSIRVGSSNDWLYEGKRDSYYRWPQLQLTEEIKQSPFKIRTPFGGNIYLWSPAGVADTLSVTLKNVVEAPLFTYDQSSKWESEIRKKKGLWADMQGEHVVLTMPASSIRNLPDPTETMKQWDKVVATMHDFLTFDPFTGRGQWVVCDLQISAGYMHAGYPIGVQLDVADPTYESKWGAYLFNLPFLKRVGGWGMYHEFGHNMQYGEWTIPGTGEVTNNVFALYTMDKLNGWAPWQYWLPGTAKSFFAGEVALDKWQSQPFTALCSYAQIARDFGWEHYQSIFKEYEALPSDQKPKTDEEEIDQWMIRFSKQIKRNLVPFYEFWSFPVRANVLEAVKEFPAYLPSDETTNEYAVDRAQSIMTKYGIAKLGP